MTSKLRIDLSHKTERVRFSGTPPLNYLTVTHSYLSFWAENSQVWSRQVILNESKIELSNFPNMSYTHKGRFGEICLIKLRCEHSVN